MQAPIGWEYTQYMLQIKRKYGDRLTLMGNINIDLLGRGRPEKIRKEVRKLIEVAAPGEDLFFPPVMN